MQVADYLRASNFGELAASVAKTLDRKNPQANAVYQRLKREAAGLRAAIIASHWALTPLLAMAQQFEVIPRCAHVHVVWYHLKQSNEGEAERPGPTFCCKVDDPTIVKSLPALLPAMQHVRTLRLLSAGALLRQSESRVLGGKEEALCAQALEILTKLQVSKPTQ